MPTLKFEHRLPCSAEKAWESLTPQLLARISAPLITLTPIDSLPEHWCVGKEMHYQLKLFGWIPWSHHTIVFEKLDPAARSFVTNEYGGNLKSWHHQFCLEPVDSTTSLCRDEITFDAGWWNGFVWCFSQMLYRNRYRRWIRWVRVSNTN